MKPKSAQKTGCPAWDQAGGQVGCVCCAPEPCSCGSQSTNQVDRGRVVESKHLAGKSAPRKGILDLFRAACAVLLIG